MKQLFTTLLLILSTLYAAAQGPVVDIGAAYGLDHITGPRLLKETGTLQQAEAKYPHAFAWARTKGWTNAEIMELCHVEAAWHNAFWAGENGNYSSPAPGHAVNIELPAGRFPVVFPMPFAQGMYQGKGSRFSDSNGTHTYGSTHLYVDHGRWRAMHSADRIIMRSANWGTDAGPGAWNHHYVIQHIYFSGMRRTPWMPAGPDESAGVAAWDSGEASTVRNCYFADFEKDGILFVRGTPAYVEACSMFTTSRFGIALVGGGSLTCVDISGDESGIALVGVVPGYGRPGSGKVAVFGAKQETSTSVEFRPWKGSAFMYVDGWVSASIHGVSYASSWTTPHDFISWRRGPGNFSQIEVTGTLFFGNAPRCLFYDETNGREYRFIGNAWQNEMQSFVWHEQRGLKSPWGTITPTQRTGPAGRLQHVGEDGATSWETATVYDPTGGTVAPPPPPPPPPPTPCTYTTGPWSECVNGTRTRTVTASPAGCVGTPPASSEPCTVAPPPPPPPLPSGSTGITPSDVIVVVNSADPTSRAIADHYRAVWGTTKEVTVNLGNGQSVDPSIFAAERAKVDAIQGKALALCFSVPSRVGEQNGITSAFTYGYTTNWSSNASGYGNPSAPIKRATLVYNRAVIDNARAATGTRPTGTIYTILANDGGGTAPRGDGRAPQVVGAAGDRIRALLPAGVRLEVQDNRQGCAGECQGNWLRNKTDVLAHFGSMYITRDFGTNTVIPGAYIDNLTSHGGHLPTGLGQTPITEFLPHSSSGTVIEPWMSNSTTTARQFMRVDTFSVAYFAQGRTFAEAAYRAVERPWRLLIIGDPLCAPYGGTTAPPPAPEPEPEPDPVGTWQTGPWSAWSSCRSFRQTRTRTVECVGGLCPSPQPSTSESRFCWR